MAKGDRTGNRKTREQRITIKVPELGYYLIVTDTEGTERCFFTGLHQSLPEKVRNKLVIKVVETKTRTPSDLPDKMTSVLFPPLFSLESTEKDARFLFHN